ncbi:MAG: NAD(P)-dependent oxidoreductase [Bacteroidetes bacterium]|nr:MAG: NAD(P)-dependent oxidoreductase [Bacteroidota bacterium]
MVTKILFIGATGMLGKPVLQQLVQAGFEVTALVRNAPKANLPTEVRTIEGDLQDQASLVKALENQNAVYLNLSVKQTEGKNAFHTETDGLRNLLEAIKKSPVKRLAYLSSVVQRYQGMNNFHWWVFDVKQEALRLIKASGVPYTIFYPSNFMETLAYVYRQGNKMLLAGKSNHKMYFIAGEDYGRQVAQSFRNLPTESREYDVQGTEAFTADEAVQTFITHYPHAKLSISRAPLGMLKFAGYFSTKMNYGAHILEALNNYPEPFTSQNTWDELGKPTITLPTFAQNLKP